MTLAKSACAAALAGVTLFGATSAWACIPMPRNTAGEIENARSAFVARVVAVEDGDRAECEAELRVQQIGPGDPGSRTCEAFGYARLETIHVIRGEAPEPAVAEWVAYPFCYIGWTPSVGDTVLAMVPDGTYTFRAPVTAYVDPFDQSDETVQALIAQHASE